MLLAALAAFAIPARSAFASTATFVAPAANATISQNQTFTVDASGVSGATQVYFSIDDGAGNPSQHVGDGVETAPGSGIYTWQAAIGGWTDGPYTIDAVAADGVATTLDIVSVHVTIDNTLQPLTIASIAPAADSTVSGTFTMSATPADQNNTVTTGEYSLDYGTTYLPLTADGSGNWTAAVDTVAAAVPNGDLYVEVRFADAPGNRADNSAGLLHLVVQNPQAPTIVPNTLVAEKSMWRSAETQLEVGDIVTAYNMQADGFPAPTISYLWNICRGDSCTGVTPGTDGDYTVQAADEGATLTLIASATNASGTVSTSVDFGVIAPAYVEPVVTPAPTPTPAPAPAPAPVAAPPVVTPPVAVPPAVTPPAVTPPLVTPAEQKAIGAAQKTVATEKKLVAKAIVAKKAARRMVKAAQKKVNAVIKTVAAGTPSPAAKKRLTSKVKTLVTTKQVASKKMAKAKARLKKATVAKRVADRTVKAAQVSVVAAQKAVSTGTPTRSKKRRLAKTRQTLVTATATATAKTKTLKASTAQLKVTRKKTSHAIRFARAQVATVVNAIAAPKAAPVAKKQLVRVETKLVAAKSTAAAKTRSLNAHSTKLKAALKRLAAKKVAALQP